MILHRWLIWQNLSHSHLCLSAWALNFLQSDFSLLAQACDHISSDRHIQWMSKEQYLAFQLQASQIGWHWTHFTGYTITMIKWRWSPSFVRHWEWLDVRNGSIDRFLPPWEEWRKSSFCSGENGEGVGTNAIDQFSSKQFQMKRRHGFRKKPRPFSEDDIEVLEQLSSTRTFAKFHSRIKYEAKTDEFIAGNYRVCALMVIKERRKSSIRSFWIAMQETNFTCKASYLVVSPKICESICHWLMIDRRERRRWGKDSFWSTHCISHDCDYKKRWRWKGNQGGSLENTSSLSNRSWNCM